MKKHASLDSRCGVYEVTPELAAELLANPEDRNRPMKTTVVAKYKRRLAQKLWRLTGEPILLSLRGGLLDGQHRLTACVESGVPFLTVILWGDFKFLAMGQCLPRGGDAAIALDVEEVGGDYIGVAAAVRLVILHDRARDRESSPYANAGNQKDRWTDIENTERSVWLKKNLSLIDRYRQTRTIAGKSHLFSTSPTAAAWFLAERTSSADEARAWFEGLLTGSGLGKKDIRLLARQTISNRQLKERHRVAGIELLHWISKAWSLRNDSTRQVFIVKNAESFPFFR